MIVIDVFDWSNMPLISVDDNGIHSSTALAAGSYHAGSLALSESARAHSTEVGVGYAELLKADNQVIIWTASLQSCFPVVFKFTNGDIALYHGNNASVDDLPRSQDLHSCSLASLIMRDDLEEIQLFEKGTDINAAKVGGFVQNVLRFCKENQM